MDHELVTKPLEAAQAYGAAGPFIVVVLIFVAFLCLAGWGTFRYLRGRDETHAQTIKDVVADVKESTLMMVDTVKECTRNQGHHR